MTWTTFSKKHLKMLCTKSKVSVSEKTDLAKTDLKLVSQESWLVSLSTLWIMLEPYCCYLVVFAAIMVSSGITECAVKNTIESFVFNFFNESKWYSARCIFRVLQDQMQAVAYIRQIFQAWLLQVVLATCTSTWLSSAFCSCLRPCVRKS